MNTFICTALCVSLASGCATVPAASRQSGVRTGPSPDTRVAVAEFVLNLKIGSRIKVSTENGTRVRGTLMKVTDRAVVIQPRTRVPEPPVEVPLALLRTVEVEHSNGGVGRAIAIGAAVGAGAALGVLVLLAALYGD